MEKYTDIGVYRVTGAELNRYLRDMNKLKEDLEDAYARIKGLSAEHTQLEQVASKLDRTLMKERCMTSLLANKVAQYRNAPSASSVIREARQVVKAREPQETSEQVSEPQEITTTKIVKYA